MVERAPEVAHYLAGRSGWVIDYANWIVAALTLILFLLSATVRWPLTVQVPFYSTPTAEVTELSLSRTILPEGVLVSSGDRVEVGQLIAVSNNPALAYDRMLYLEDILSQPNKRDRDILPLSLINIPPSLSVGSIDATIIAFTTAQMAFREADDAATVVRAETNLRRAYDELVGQIEQWKRTETITAPRAGTVTVMPLTVSSGYSPGTVVASVSTDRTTDLQLTLRGPDRALNKIEIGQKVRLVTASFANGESSVITGTITAIDPKSGRGLQIGLQSEQLGSTQESNAFSRVMSGTARVTVGHSSLLRALFG